MILFIQIILPWVPPKALMLILRIFYTTLKIQQDSKVSEQRLGLSLDLHSCLSSGSS